MQIEMILTTMKGYLAGLSQNAVYKFLIGIIPGIFATIINSHEELVKMVIFLYIVDFILGVTYAIKQREFNFDRLGRGAIKIMTYGIILSIGIGLDLVLHTGELVIGIMFSFLVLKDSSSIISKLDLLGFNVPIFLVKYIGVARTRLEDKMGSVLNLTDEEKKCLRENMRNNDKES